MTPNSTKEHLIVDRSNNNNIEEVKPVVKEILCNGYFYDVTNFIHRHPGGTIIEYYTKDGEDASLAIQQFHHRSSKKVSAIMSSLKKRKATEEELNRSKSPEETEKSKALTEDFIKLYVELEKEGMFLPSYSHNVYRIFEVLLIAYIGYCLLFYESFAVRGFGIFMIGLAQGRVGWIQHESGHHSLTGVPKLDRIFHAILFGVAFGLSSTWWARGHNRHHAMPQRLKHDVDLDTLPLIAYNRRVINDSKKGKTFLIQNQVYLFLAIDTFLATMIWQWYLHPKYVLKHRRYLEIFSILIHYVLASYIGFWPWLISKWFMSIYLFGNFSLSHSHLPVTSEPTHWVEYSLVHTADVAPSFLCDWWMGYLNYQIEHHLFPTMPQFRHRLIHKRVEALADKHNIPYVVYGYKEALLKTFENLKNVSEEFARG